MTVEALCRKAAKTAGFDPDERVNRPGMKPWPRWCEFRSDVEARLAADNAAEAGSMTGAEQPEIYRNSPVKVFGIHDEGTLTQMRNCMSTGRAAGGVICADGHLGYAQPVGGVIAYDGQVSISGVGFDIACGNKAVRLDTPYSALQGRETQILADIRRVISFGVGRVNDEKIEHELFDDAAAWAASGMQDFRQKAKSQLGSIGSGNHYIDLMRDENDYVWIGVHFGSRGLGHTTATRYLKAAGGKDGMHVPPAVVNADSMLGQDYLAAMELAGRYAYAGRDWVVERVRRIVGGSIKDSVHNHHNYLWLENHGGRELMVVRKGATPAFPGQRGFIGGSMGDDAVIVEGIDSPLSREALYSTVHGAGRLFSRTTAKKTFTRTQMDNWLRERGVYLSGGDLDESPMAYRRLPEVLEAHRGTIRIIHTLRPFAVAMAGSGEVDPYKD